MASDNKIRERFSPGTMLTQAASFSLIMLQASFLPLKEKEESFQHLRKKTYQNKTIELANVW
jgi:hypothetical protein